MYTIEQLEKMDAKAIAGCSEKHQESVIAELIETCRSLAARATPAQPVLYTMPDPNVVFALHDAILALPLPEPWERGDGNHEDKYLESQVRGFRSKAAALAEQAYGLGWFSVDDQLPELDAPVWLYEEGRGAWIGGRSDSGEGWLWCNAYGSHYQRADGTWSASSMEIDDDYRPTHWMSLPSAPSIAQDGQKSEARDGTL